MISYEQKIFVPQSTMCFWMQLQNWYRRQFFFH